MAIISRLAGAILCQTDSSFYLVGDLKEPLDFTSAGFDEENIEPLKKPWVKLSPNGRAIDKGSEQVLMEYLADDALVEKLADLFMIKRNGSISERLWGLMLETNEVHKDGVPDCTWLAQTPEDVWDMVRETVLKC
ncbi:MAG: precorrin-3B C(17)-methyltransferase [Zetaproteobacteria bacterium]|nr:precorrin-3B C(17)-methyltransferase [Pseudobdellovibrionaceae bacterium]